MKAASAQMDTLLSTGGPFFIADLYKITLNGGSPEFYFTDADVDLVVNSITYTKSGLLISRDKTRLVTGLESSTIALRISAPDDYLVGLGLGNWYYGMPWMQAIQMGILDGAKISVERLIAPNWNDTSAGSIKIFEGEVRGIEREISFAKVTLVSEAYKFDMQLPKNSFMPGCANSLYDSKCKVSLSDPAHYLDAAITGASTNFEIVSSSVIFAIRWQLGSVEFITGANAGISRMITATFTNRLRFSQPLPMQPSIGDTFRVRRGCTRTASACLTTFRNLANFRGFPYVPNPEAIA
jgi:uncharacterized phage protein (TIGR02218 family)